MINPAAPPCARVVDEASRLADIGRPPFEFKFLSLGHSVVPASKAVTYGRNHSFRGFAVRFR
jgi:hypothetical protein